MKTISLLFVIILSATAHAQLLSGTLVDEGRELKETKEFVIEGTQNGSAVYELAVDREGNVTSARLVETTLNSTPTTMKVRDYAMGFKFESGTHFPKFHHVQVKITAVKVFEQAKEIIDI